MTITPEQLEMLKRLKDPIDEYMGEWQIKDDLYQDSFGEGFIFRKYATRNVEAVDVWFKPTGVMSYDIRVLNDFAIRIPPFCPPDGKRCLTEMLTDKGKEYLYECYHTSITILLRSDDYYSAILKALIAQEGV
jgi:hypothetical protein